MHHLLARRNFLSLLAGSPLFAQTPPHETAITSPKDALNVMDFEALARKALPPAHWGYLTSGADDDLTLHMNRDGFSHYQLRPRRLVDVSSVELRTTVLGEAWEMPIYLSAVGGQKAFHPEGELATARAARAMKATQMLSTVSSFSVEEVAKSLGAAPWYQLYMPAAWAETEKMVQRAEAAGCRVLVWTIDLIAGRNTETAIRFARQDTRDCMSCHAAPPLSLSPARNRSRPMFTGLSGEMNPRQADWSYVDRLKKITKMKLLLKGIDHADDARLARDHGADGVIVSNHGGRSAETGRATIDVLPEVVDAVSPQMPVFVDGGFRRGTDVFKALALGAKAVGIGRPYVWGLAGFGQQGVERSLEMLRDELALVMRQCGATSIANITRASILRYPPFG